MSDPIRTLRQATQSLVGRRCLGVVGGWGSYLSIEFEPAYIRRRPVDNSKMVAALRNHMGEVSLFLTDAAWRLTRGRRILVGSLDKLRSRHEQAAIRALAGLRVVVVELVEPGWMLKVSFTRGIALEVFPVSSEFCEGVDGYSVLLPRRTFSVLPGGRVGVEQSKRWQRMRVPVVPGKSGHRR